MRLTRWMVLLLCAWAIPCCAQPKHKFDPYRDRTVQFMFEQVNNDYFEGQLSNVRVQWGNLAVEKARGLTRFYDNGSFLIEIDRRLNSSPDAAAFTLNHEACHVATHAAIAPELANEHGQIFQNCMARFPSKRGIHPTLTLARLFAKSR